MKTLSYALLFSVLLMAPTTFAAGAKATEVKFKNLMTVIPAEFLDQSYDVEDGEGGMVYLKYGETDTIGLFKHACSLWVMDNKVTGQRSLIVNREPNILEFVNGFPVEVVAEITGSASDTFFFARDSFALARFAKGDARISIAKSKDGNLLVEAKSANDKILCRGVHKMEPAVPF